jgi:two-component system response regulator DesR
VIRILLAHKATLLRRALAAVLSQEEDLHIVAELARGDDVLPVAMRERPHVVVLDQAVPGSAALFDVCTRLHGALPDCGVLLVLDRCEPVGAGVALARLVPRVGLIATEASPAQLIESVRRIARGEPVLDIDLAVAALTAKDSPLTARERQILRLAAGGAPVKEIAAQLFLCTGTVRNYLSRIVTKTGGRTRIEAIRIAQEAGWI